MLSILQHFFFLLNQPVLFNLSPCALCSSLLVISLRLSGPNFHVPLPEVVNSESGRVTHCVLLPLQNAK